jgi:hypothetical protein
MALDHPLQQCDCDALNKVLESAPRAIQLAEACKECGWDASEFEAQLKAQLEMAKKAKATFFPGMP